MAEGIFEDTSQDRMLSLGLAIVSEAAAIAAAKLIGRGDEHSPYYLRFILDDQPGALAQLAAALGDTGVSIHRMRQYVQAGRGHAGRDRHA